MQQLRALSDLAGRLPQTPSFVLHSACSEPALLASMLATESAAFVGASVFCLMPMGEAPYGDAPASDHLKVTTFFPGRGLRASVSAGRAQTLRHPLSAIPALFDRGSIHANILLLQVSPPDDHGRVSLGLAVDYMHAVLRQKPLVVAEINPRLPRTSGDASFDATQIDWFVDAKQPPQAVPPAASDAVDARIAANVAGLIEDGNVLQLGIGSLPDQVLGCLHDRRHLGVHSGIVTDAVRPLIESGVVDNSTKREFRGVTVTTMAAGTQSFYDFLDRNAAIEFQPSSRTHDAETLASIEGMTAINSALQIDLLGRVNAETIAGRVIAAPGGLPDFARGASRAKNGRSILALRASFKSESNIVVNLPADAPVTISAADIDYVVTEFGVAALRHRSAIQCAKALIEIADPIHRPQLSRALSSWS